MRKIHFVLVLLMVLAIVGCKDDETFGEDSAACDQAWTDMLSQTFVGNIYLCDYSSPKAKATVVRGSGDLISIHIVADSIPFDTTLFYTAHCHLAEKIDPQIRIEHAAIADEFGEYSDRRRSLCCFIPGNNCNNGYGTYSVFSGYAE